MTYDYLVVSTGQVVQVEQRMSEPAHTVLEIDGELRSVKRLISAAPSFTLIPGASGGWANEGYSTPENFRKAERRLGHKVHRKL